MGAAAGCQQYVDPRAIDERHAGKVEGEPSAVPAHGAQQLIPQLRTWLDVDLSADRHDRARPDAYVQGRRVQIAGMFARHTPTVRTGTCPPNPANS
jgi:hypothetical protein